jgi:hypothetical protein
MPTSFVRLWLEDNLLRFPVYELVPFPPSVSIHSRQPASVPPAATWELFCWLGGGRLPTVNHRGRWLVLAHFNLFLPVLVWRLLVDWLPRLLRRDLRPLVRFSGNRWVVVLRDWGELSLPLVRDYYGFRLPLRLELAGGGPLLASFFRLRSPFSR